MQVAPIIHSNFRDTTNFSPVVALSSRTLAGAGAVGAAVVGIVVAAAVVVVAAVAGGVAFTLPATATSVAWLETTAVTGSTLASDHKVKPKCRRNASSNARPAKMAEPH